MGFNINGSMKPGVPHSYFVSVSSVMRQAIPKSARQTFLPPFTFYELFINIFSGLMSLCTIYFRCISAIASSS